MFEVFALRFQKFSPVALRFGLAAVFLLFGLKKLINPEQVTAEIQLLLNFELADAAAINFYLGLIEMILAGAFLIGLKIRIFALVGALLIGMFFLSFFVKYGISINPDLYRDVGLFGAAFALFLLGAGPWSIDEKLKIKDEK